MEKTPAHHWASGGLDLGGELHECSRAELPAFIGNFRAVNEQVLIR